MNRTWNRDRIIAIVMLLPSIALLAVFVYGFIGWTTYTSMTDSDMAQQLSMSGQQAEFVGLENYEDLFSRRSTYRFRVGATNTVFFTGLFIATCLGVGLLLAILLDQKVVGESFFRTVFLFPMALSFVVTGVVWKWLFNPDSGINVLPTVIGLEPGQFNWFISQEQWFRFNWQGVFPTFTYITLGIVSVLALWYWMKHRRRSAGILALGAAVIALFILAGGPQAFPTTSREEMHGFNLALFALVMAAGWQMSGYTMAMYLAGLRGIPEELREAARVDGATELGVYRHIILPMLAPITLSAIIILGHISLKIFDLVYVMGGGDLLSIDMPGVYMYQTAFRGGETAQGAAVAVLMLIFVAIVIVPYLVSQLRGD